MIVKNETSQLVSQVHLELILSQPNNNYNPNNKTTITVVGMSLSNRWENTTTTTHPHHHTNSKLNDRAEIEQNSENKSYLFYMRRPKKSV